MNVKRTLTTLLLVCMASIWSCSTSVRDVPTPFGSRPGNQIGRFEIIGVLSRTTSTLRRPNANAPFEETFTVDVPPGTHLIVPAVRGWVNGFGTTDPENLATETDVMARWRSEDHYYGLGQVNVSVESISAVDDTATPPTQRATVVVRAILSDHNSDDQWFAAVNFTLLCLRRIE